jgi:sugar/nucleoside kinase (ribokinase family)
MSRRDRGTKGVLSRVRGLANRAMRRALVVGHLCADLRPKLAGGERIIPGEIAEVGSLIIRPGGCVANTGGDLAALGAPVCLCADLGDDELGSGTLKSLKQLGADCEGVRQVAGQTTSYSLVFEPPGADRSFWHHVGANASFDGRRVDPVRADLVHLGYPALLPLMYADGGNRLEELLTRVREAGATASLDLSTIGPGSPAAQVDWSSLLHRTVPLVDVFSPSVDDLVSALGILRPASAVQVRELGLRLLNLGAAVVLLTNGALGMHLFTAGEERLSRAGRCLSELAGSWADGEFYLPAGASRPMVTTGAGDAATAGLLYGVLTQSAAEEAVSMAASAAAFKVAGLWRLPRYSVAAPSS